jgi:hypothetical protein
MLVLAVTVERLRVLVEDIQDDNLPHILPQAAVRTSETGD